MRRIATLNDNGDPSSSIATPSRLHKEVLLFTEAAPTWFRLVSAQLGLHQSRPMSAATFGLVLCQVTKGLTRCSTSDI